MTAQEYSELQVTSPKCSLECWIENETGIQHTLVLSHFSDIQQELKGIGFSLNIPRTTTSKEACLYAANKSSASMFLDNILWRFLKLGTWVSTNQFCPLQLFDTSHVHDSFGNQHEANRYLQVLQSQKQIDLLQRVTFWICFKEILKSSCIQKSNFSPVPPYEV